MFCLIIHECIILLDKNQVKNLFSSCMRSTFVTIYKGTPSLLSEKRKKDAMLKMNLLAEKVNLFPMNIVG